MAKIVAFAVLLAVVLVQLAEAQKKTGSRYDHIDIDSVLSNDRILTSYIKCVLGEGPCTPEGNDLKKTLPDAIKNECSKCTEKQKVSTRKVIQHLQEKRKRDWARLIKKYDPSGEYSKKFQKN